MPCVTYTDGEIADRLSVENKRLRDLLCMACGHIFYSNPNPKDVRLEVKNWWQDHKREDAQRVRMELEAEAACKQERQKKYDLLKKEFG